MTEKKLNNKIVQSNDRPLTVEKIRECPECSSKNIITDYKRAEISCADCGAIIAENIVDLGPEWRAFDSEQWNKIRAERTNPYSASKGLGTPYQEIPGLKMSGKRRIGATISSNQKALTIAFREVNNLCSKLKLPKTIEQEAIKLCRKAQKKRLFLGPGGVEIAAIAIVLIACDKQKIPRSMRQISDIVDFKLTEISTKYKKTKRVLGITIVSNNDPIALLPKLCSELGLNMEVERLAKEIVEKAKKLGLTNGRRPNTIAAVSIYLAAALEYDYRNQEDIVRVAGITEVTLRKRSKEISEELSKNYQSMNFFPWAKKN